MMGIDQLSLLPLFQNPEPHFFRTGLALLTGLVLMGLGACATVPPTSDVDARAEFDSLNDPAEPLNRSIHKFNQGVDRVLIEPIAITYSFIIPKPLRFMITNILRNLAEPLTLVNDILQGEGKRAGTTAGRFITNTTIGIGGSFDVATDMGMERHSEDFGQTLGAWGITEGPYLVLPLLGPSNIRDGAGQLAGLYGDPTYIAIGETHVSGLSLGLMGMTALDARYRNLDTLRDLGETSIDVYATMRSAYRQNRRKEVRNGAFLSDEDDFDIFDDFDTFDDPEPGREPEPDPDPEPEGD
jgi:phospholipid-binding lipoprotein MlaA